MAGLLVVTGALAAQSLLATRAVRRTADRGLTHIANVAAWEYSRRLSVHLERTARMTLWPIARLDGRVNRSELPGKERLPRVDSLFLLAPAMQCDCETFRAASYFEMPVDGTLADSIIFVGADWIPADSVILSAVARAPRTATTGFTGMQMLLSAPVVMALPSSGDRPRLVIAARLHDRAGAPFRVYGLLVDPESLRDVLRRSSDGLTLLPSAIAVGVPSDSLVEVSVRASNSGTSVGQMKLSRDARL